MPVIAAPQQWAEHAFGSAQRPSARSRPPERQSAVSRIEAPDELAITVESLCESKLKTIEQLEKDLEAAERRRSQAILTGVTVVGVVVVLALCGLVGLLIGSR